MYVIITYKRDDGWAFCVWNRVTKIIRKHYITYNYFSKAKGGAFGEFDKSAKIIRIYYTVVLTIIS